MDEKEKLYLMLEEYRSVRAEELDRTRLQHQHYAIAVVLCVLIGGFGLWIGARELPLFLVVVTAVLFAIPIALLQHDIHSACHRAKEVEAELNRRLGERMFARETERKPLALSEQLPDREAMRQRWSSMRMRTREHGERWRRGLSQFRDTVRGERSAREPAKPAERRDETAPQHLP